MKTLSKILVSLAVVVCWASTASANLVVNPGFETGNFTGWTQSGNTGLTTVNFDAAHSGSFGARFGPTGSNGFIAQDLVTVAGATYDLSFWLSNLNGLPTNHFEASWNGSVISTSVLDDAAAFPYTQFTFHLSLCSLDSGTILSPGFSMMSQ